MRRPLRLVVPALAALALAQPRAASAQFQVQEVREPGQTPGWSLTPSIALSSGWDSNVSMVGIDESETTGSLSVISPSLEAAYQGKRNWFGAGYTGSFSLYHQLDGLNTFDQHFRVDTRHLLSKRVTLNLHDTFAAVPTTDAIMLSDLPFVRTGSKLNDAGATLSVALDSHTRATATYGFTWVAFDERSPYAGLLRGGTAHAVSGGLERQIAPRWSIGGNASYRRSLIARLGEGVGITEASGMVSYDATRTLSVSAALGVSHVGASSLNRSRTGPAWNVSAVQRFQRATLSAGWSRSFVPAFGLGGSIQNEQVDVTLAMPAARNRLFWQGGLSWRRHAPLLAEEQTLHALWIQTSVGYALHRRVRLEAFYARSQQDSLRPGGKIHRDRLGIQVVTSKPMRIK
jgi:hypothetical protein